MLRHEADCAPDVGRPSDWYQLYRVAFEQEFTEVRQYPGGVDIWVGGPADLPLADLLAVVQHRVPAQYTVVGLDLYRDGRDSVSMRNGKLHQIVAVQPITLLSFGDPRRMLIKAKAAGSRLRLGLQKSNRGLCNEVKVWGALPQRSHKCIWLQFRTDPDQSHRSHWNCS